MKKTIKHISLLPPEEEIQLFNQIVKYIGDELMLIDSNARIVYVNDATVKGLGYPRNKIINKKIFQFMKDRMSMSIWKKDHLGMLKRTRKPVSFVFERVVKGKKIQTINVTAVYMKFKSKDYVLSLGHDITHEVNMSKRIRQSEQIYRLLSDGAADGIVTLDLDGTLAYANKAAERLTRIPFRISKGKHFKNFIEKRSLTKAVACFTMAKKGESELREEIEIIDRGKNIIPVEINISPLWEGGKISRIHVIMRDMRRRKALESLQLESETMKALNNFIYGTTQEIKYPLKAVLDRLQTVSKIYKNRDFEYLGYREYKQIMETIENVQHQVKYCYDIASRLITLNKRRAKTIKKASDIDKVIHSSVNLVDEQFMRTNTRVKLKVDSQLPLVLINELELNEVIVNVLTNAVQSMPAGGTVTISAYLNKLHDRVCIHIKDQGVGIKKEYLSQIFEPFFTTKQRGLEKSSGLGLSIVYSIVRAHGGDIFVESSLRGGTLVKIELPVKRSRRS